MPAEVIAIANHKGGVGKSFTSVSLAAGLARGGWRTLLVDCDPQANATSMFDPDDDVEFDLYDVIKHETAARQGHPTDTYRADCTSCRRRWPLPSSTRSSSRCTAVRTRSAAASNRCWIDYEAIVLDLSPNLGSLVIAALSAASSLIIPTDASRWGRRGVAMFLEWSTQLRNAKVLDAELLGVLLTKYEETTKVSRQVLADLKASDTPMFNTLIPKRVAAERMVSELAVLGDSNADADLSTAYANFTVEVMERVSAAQERRGRHARA